MAAGFPYIEITIILYHTTLFCAIFDCAPRRCVLQYPHNRSCSAKRRMGRAPQIGILCADEKNFTQHLYDTCGVFLEDQALCIVAGARHLPEFSALLERRGHFHNGLLRQELIGLGRALVSPPLTSGRLCWSVAICRTLYGCHPTDCPAPGVRLRLYHHNQLCAFCRGPKALLRLFLMSSHKILRNKKVFSMEYVLIGCGRIAVNHIKAVINNQLELAAVCDVKPEPWRLCWPSTGWRKTPLSTATRITKRWLTQSSLSWRYRHRERAPCTDRPVLHSARRECHH